MSDDVAVPRLKLTRFAQTTILIAIFLLVIFDVFIVLLAVGGEPDHSDVIAEVQSIRQQIVEINPVEERTALNLAECRTNPTEGN